MYRFHLIYTSLYILSLVFVSAFFVTAVHAQTAPEFIASWNAATYVPSEYLGKIFPSQGSLTEVSFNLVEKNKVLDLSRYEIRWDINGTLFKIGNGLQRIQFQNNTPANQNTVRITVVYDNNTELTQTLVIPVKRPLLVIDTSLSNRTLSSGTTFFRAIPYFFNATNLSAIQFRWFQNGKPITNREDNPEILALNIPSGTTNLDLNLSATASNLLNLRETASRVIGFHIK